MQRASVAVSFEADIDLGLLHRPSNNSHSGLHLLRFILGTRLHQGTIYTPIRNESCTSTRSLLIGTHVRGGLSQRYLPCKHPCQLIGSVPFV